MRKPQISRRVGVGFAAALACAIAVPLGLSSSHREAPSIMLDPAADNTDVYAWTASDSPNSITVASNWIPGQVPANGPNFFRFDDRARYYINFDNNGDGVVDIAYRYEFETALANPNSFLYAGPGSDGYEDLNLSQTYDVTREEFKKGELTDTETVATDLDVAPANVGPKTFPDYEGDFVPGAIEGLPGGGKVFAGQREESFFVDLGATFDAINIREDGTTGNEGGGKDDFSGYNTSSIVMQVPEADVTKNGQPVADQNAANAVVGVWSTTERRKLEVQNADYNSGSPGSVNGKKNKWVQVSRLGNPLVNEVIIPLGMKDKFNRTTPDRDAELYGQYVVEPELAAVLNALFDVGAPTTDRTDIVQAVLQGLPGLNEHSGKFAGTPVDTIKLNLGVAPAVTPNRFGALSGDTAGYPNGRRLTDDVVDIDLQVVAGILADPQNAVALGDGVDVNDTSFLSTFPYLATPYSGFDSAPSDRIEPDHAPVGPGGGP